MRQAADRLLTARTGSDNPDWSAAASGAIIATRNLLTNRPAVPEPLSLAAVATVGAVAGGALGSWLGRRGVAPTRQRLQQVEQELLAQQGRAAEAARTMRAQINREVQQARAAWQAEQAAATAAQRAEVDKLTRHLSDACDELDRLRAAAARAPSPPDTGQGFAATMPLGDL